MTVGVKARIAGSLCGALVLLAGCSTSPSDVAIGKINGLQYLGDGRKIEYQRMVEEAADKGQEKLDTLVATAELENDFVGKPLEGPHLIERFPVTFNEDGTITDEQKALEEIGSPTHWQVGVSKFRMCWSPECEYYSSWSIGIVQSNAEVKYTIHLEGLEEEDIPVELEFFRSLPS